MIIRIFYRPKTLAACSKLALMKYSVFFIVFAALFSASIKAQQPEPGTPIYRVEVVLVKHANGQSDRRPAEELDDFSDLIDPLRRARALAAEAAWQERQRELELELALEQVPIDPDDPRLAMEVIEALDALVEADGEGAAIPAEAATEADEDAPIGPILPETFLQLEELSATMADAWRRLSASGQFQPLSWRAWYQPLSRQQPSPQVRVHDDEIIRIRWFNPEQMLPSLPLDPLSRSFDLNAYLPESDYRLDGSFRLRQRQFMHVELDLVWREPAEPSFGPLDSAFLNTADYEIHRLLQSRTVRTDRLEYFDSALFGVLVLIQRWEPEEHDQARAVRETAR